MHVLVVTVVHHPEDARILDRQIGALVHHGVEVTYAAPFSATGTAPPPDVATVDLPRASGRRRLAAVRAARQAIKAHRDRVDLVLLHDPDLLLAVAGLRRPPTVWDVHEDTAAALSDRRWLPRPLRPLVRACVRMAERLAERQLHLILAEEGYRPRFRRTHPVVPNEPVVPAEVAPTGTDRVVYVGRISKRRGAHDLLALADLLPEGMHLALVGPADNDVEADLEAAAAADRLRWHGRLPAQDALEIIQGSLAGLSPLHDEPNYRHSRPTKIIDYMSRGVPVITTPLPAAVEIVERFDCGLVVPFRDPAAIAAAIQELVSAPDERATMGRRGHEAAHRHFDWSQSGASFVNQLVAWARTGQTN